MSVESHLSKAPFKDTDDWTKNVIELFSFTIVKTGASARVTDESRADAKRKKIVNCIFMADTLRLSGFIVNRKFAEELQVFLKISGTWPPRNSSGRAIPDKCLVQTQVCYPPLKLSQKPRVDTAGYRSVRVSKSHPLFAFPALQ